MSDTPTPLPAIYLVRAIEPLVPGETPAESITPLVLAEVEQRLDQQAADWQEQSSAAISAADKSARDAAASANVASAAQEAVNANAQAANTAALAAAESNRLAGLAQNAAQQAVTDIGTGAQDAQAAALLATQARDEVLPARDEVVAARNEVLPARDQVMPAAAATLQHADAAAAAKNAAALSATAADKSRIAAEAAKNQAVTAQNNIVAVIRGVTASLIRPAYTVDFTAGDSLPADWVCARATPALRVNAFGALESVPANTGRIEYDPATGECLGLLREPGCTNLFVGSEKWNALSGQDGTSVITQGLGYANPIGAAEVAVVKKAVGRQDVFYQYSRDREITPNVRNVYSIIVKPVANVKNIKSTNGLGHRWYFLYDLATKVITLGANVGWAEVQEYHGGWLRFSVCEKTAGTATTELAAVIATPLNPADPAEFWTTGYQIHTGDAPASYIKTETTAVTRASDQLYTPLGAWFNRNGGEGTLIVDMDVRRSGAGTNSLFFGLSKSASLASGQDYGLTVYAGFEFLTQNPTNVGPAAGFQTGRVKVAVSANSAGKRICKTGGAVLSALGAGLNDVTLAQFLTVGGGSASDVTAYIRRVSYYPRSLSDADMLALTR